MIVIGGGLVSLQILSALFRDGVKFTLLVSSGQVLSQSVDADCAAIVQQEIESRGVSVLFGRNVREIKQRGRKAVVSSGSGEEWLADLVVVGKGVQPNVQLVSNSGIRVNRGILVDEFMRTNINSVFAAGDVSEGINLVTGEREILPNWSNATRQGRIAGLNMAGCPQRFEGGLRENITSVFGLSVTVIGLSTAGGNNGMAELRFSEPRKKVYRKILLSDNKIVGAILLGTGEDSGIIGWLIRNRIDISRWRDKIARIPLNMREIMLPVFRRGNQKL